MELHRTPMFSTLLPLISLAMLVGCTTTSTTYKTGATSSPTPDLIWSFPEDVRSLFPSTPETTAMWEKIKTQTPSIWRSDRLLGFSETYVEIKISPNSGSLEISNYTPSEYNKRGDLMFVAEDSDGRWGTGVFDYDVLPEGAFSGMPEQYRKSRPAAIQIVSDWKIKFYSGHLNGVPSEANYEYVSSTSDFLNAESDKQFRSLAALKDIPLPSVWESVWDPDPTKYNYISGYIRLTLSEDETGNLQLTNTGSEPSERANFPASGEVIFRGSAPGSTLGTVNLYVPKYSFDDALAALKNGRGELKFPSIEELRIVKGVEFYPFRYVSGVDKNGIPIYLTKSPSEVNNRCEEWSFDNNMEYENFEACVNNNLLRKN